jgi:hypothetical protein
MSSVEPSNRSVKRFLSLLAAFNAMVFFGLAGGCAAIDFCPTVYLSLAAAGVALMFAAATFLKG